MKKLISLILSLTLLFSLAVPALAAGEGSFANFRTVAAYSDGLFQDIHADDWYRDSVAAVYELDLMKGDQGLFRPADNVTLAEAVTLAARLHSLFASGKAVFEATDPWYQTYVDYAVRNGILSDASEDWTAAASRGRFAAILAKALPTSALPAINTVADDQLPDVKMDSENAAEIYRLYRAGILAGNNKRGAYAPDTPIQRSAVAAIVSRMAYRSLRQKFVLEVPQYPDLTEQSAMGDGFFVNSAMLGNSLAQGMQLYSGLSDAGMKFFCYQSVTVSSADTYVTQLCQNQYDKVYIEYGINEIYMDSGAFATAYGKIVDRIRAAMPDAEIYVMVITPVTKARSDAGSFTMTRIDSMNAALYEMCKEKECWYLDCCTLLEDDTGYLVADYAGWDGSPHLSASGYKAWADVIRTYYA